MSGESLCISSRNIYDEFLAYSSKAMSDHPFSKLYSSSQIISLLPHYLGMSIAFPYLQAGSQLNLIQEVIRTNIDIPEHIEITSVIGNFLCWDETGGAYVMDKLGKPGLPEILNTKKWFHSNLLKNDIEHFKNCKQMKNTYFLCSCVSITHNKHVIYYPQ